MPKIATIKSRWKRSPSSDIVKAKVVFTMDGLSTTTDVDPSVEEFVFEAAANSSFQVRIDSYDSDDLIASSQTVSRTLGDLEGPLPATDLTLEIISVRDGELPPALALTAKK